VVITEVTASRFYCFTSFDVTGKLYGECLLPLVSIHFLLLHQDERNLLKMWLAFLEIVQTCISHRLLLIWLYQQQV